MRACASSKRLLQKSFRLDFIIGTLELISGLEVVGGCANDSTEKRLSKTCYSHLLPHILFRAELPILLKDSTFQSLNGPIQNMAIDCEAMPWLTEFRPRRGLLNGHVQTILGNYLPRPRFSLNGEAETVVVDPADGSRVLCFGHWQPESKRARALTVVLVHGLEGSSDSRYMQGMAMRAFAADCNVVRMNMRNCGGSDALTPTLYHSGLSGDVGAVVQHYVARYGLEQFALVGYSMGGNLVLKLAGEWGAREPLRAVASVCPAIDLAAGSDALHEPANRIYEWHFLRRLLQRFRRKAQLFPQVYTKLDFGPIRSLRQFDDRIVAHYCGFTGADDYYYRASSARVIDGIAIPTLMLRALDDPFIRLTEQTRDKILSNRKIQMVETAHGGHCAYLGADAGDDIHWAESTVIRYLLHHTAEDHGS